MDDFQTYAPRDLIPPASPVPWTLRDVWTGVGALGVWMLLAFGAALALTFEGWDFNAGVYITIFEALLIVPVWWLTIHKYGVGWDSLGWRPFRGVIIGIGCGLMVGSLMFNAIYGYFLDFFHLQIQMDFVSIFSQMQSPWWLLVGGILVAPVVEEIFFRGFIFAGLREHLGWKKAALISAGLFALIHLEPTAIPSIFLLGLIFAYLYHRSNSIWPSLLMHCATNTMALFGAFLASRLM